MINSFSPYVLSLIIPVFNNGSYLEKVCFPSLINSTIFSQMEIIIVDDGSTDLNTISIIEALSKQYSNICTYFFPPGGSGTASRARNYGINLASSEYITYLDPDNEAINDGYYKLYQVIQDSDFDMVAGNLVVNDGSENFTLNYYTKFIISNYLRDICSNVKHLLIASNFSANSIQATIFKKKLIIDHQLAMAEGAIGQDTIFFYSAVLCSKQIKAINQPIHIYYNKNSTSVTNTINLDYFRKRYLNEVYKLDVLSKHNLLAKYYTTKQDTYFKSYIFNKLKLLEPNERCQAKAIMDEIYQLYNNQWHIKDIEMRQYFNQKSYHI
ncbi:MAG: glycosyltransferase family 2 protein [bacterium]|nr:glycosyltransferase family 2 protein [bacterium]